MKTKKIIRQHLHCSLVLAFLNNRILNALAEEFLLNRWIFGTLYE